MTIDEAIRRIETYTGFAENDETAKDEDALKLGIEALKVIKGSRNVGSVVISPLLPGETES